MAGIQGRKDVGELHEAIQRVLRQVEAEIQCSEGNGVKVLNKARVFYVKSDCNPIQHRAFLS